MSADANRKTLRHFYCRDALWLSFERMSEDMDRGLDDLVNEAMRVFARDKGYLPTENEGRPAGPPQGVRAATPAASAAPRPPVPAPPPPPAAGRNTAAFQGRPLQAHVPQTQWPAAEQPAPQADRSGSPLYLVFQNQKYLVDKEQFIIGRGAKSSDLAIRDGNISRKHAAVIRRNGGYFIKDLGSTNGIDYNGTRIDNKRIEEGDRFTICDYELRFTYR
jgi:hypothetical protein